MNKKTISYNLDIISRSGNKKHWKIRKVIGDMEELISGYRLTAFKMKGTAVATLCNKNANVVEKALREAILGRYSEEMLVLSI